MHIVIMENRSRYLRENWQWQIFGSNGVGLRGGGEDENRCIRVRNYKTIFFSRNGWKVETALSWMPLEVSGSMTAEKLRHGGGTNAPSGISLTISRHSMIVRYEQISWLINWSCPGVMHIICRNLLSKFIDFSITIGRKNRCRVSCDYLRKFV